MLAAPTTTALTGAHDAMRRSASVAGFWTSAWHQFCKNKLAKLAAFFIVAIAAIAVIVPELLPQTYSDQDLSVSLQGPSWAHPMGTDALGRDLMTRLIFGARISLTVGVVVQCVILLIGVPMGLIAGYVGGKTDTLIMRFVDVLYAMPNLLFVILIMTFLRGQFGSEPTGFTKHLADFDARTGGLIGVYIGLGLVSWLTVARIVRANTMSLKEKEYVEAARGLGAHDSQIVRRHLLPNTIAPIVVAATLGIPGAILYEAGISFLGLGVLPPMPSWGLMISDAIPQMRSHPYMLVFPALVLSLTVLAFNFIGDGLRDALDPWMKR
ncbi:MAG: ABC transporter permease [Chloroflexia bacterium]|nr:ABC transporter permease [Chloroflexia bacterium]